MLGALGENKRGAIEAVLPPEQKDDATRSLAFGRSAVARLVTPKIWRCDRGLTDGDAMAALRYHGHQIDVAQNCYIADGGQPRSAERSSRSPTGS
jgi:hypothetical protein